MRRYTQYLGYVLRHKFYVTLECFKRGLIWRGIKHDLSKSSPIEFLAYAYFFHNPDGSKKQVRDKTGYYKPDDTGDPAFDRAWFHHVQHNDHHWQHWCCPLSESFGIKPFPMPKAAVLEMIADWNGAARAQKSTGTVRAWYIANKPKMKLHPETETMTIGHLEYDEMMKSYQI